MSSPFPLPLIFTAWGFRSGADAWNGAEDLAARCKAAKIKTVAVQLGVDDHSGIPWTTRPEADVLRSRGLRVVVWGVAGSSYVVQDLHRLGATERDWLPQIEGPGQGKTVLDAIAQGLNPSAIVTTYSGAGGEDQSVVPKLRTGGVKAVFVECYAEAGYPHTDINLMLWQGTKYGWKPEELFAAFGTYRGEMPPAYDHTDKVGRSFGLYLSEPMSGTQWNVWGAYNPTPPPQPTGPTSAITRGKITAAAKEWESAQANIGGLARITNARRICQAEMTDERWAEIARPLKKLLDTSEVP